VEFDRAASRELRKLGLEPSDVCCAICASASPSRGSAPFRSRADRRPQGALALRVGDYRIVATIEDDRFVVLW
jgi:mRNA-degrading endonuclease RelE of RelBE toxin-antitoxin system